MTETVRVCGKRILLVDDDPSVRQSIKLLLNIDRHQVFEARNGQEALEMFHQRELDLVILDFFMPQMEGSKVAEHIKLTAPNLPILMVTAYKEKLVEWQGPIDRLLPKPLGIEDLREAIVALVQ